MGDKKVTIEVNGQEIETQAGRMLIEIADEVGIPVPRFCYHKKLSVAANCRMCLVEMQAMREGMENPVVPACATPIGDGMKFYTKSPKAIAAQKGVMEFLLINHPLDCPICDQGGECELQDIAIGYGEGYSQYTEAKRVVKNKDLGPLIATDMTRCIHCTRCVRFGEEIAGTRELGMIGRGEHTEITTYLEHSISSEMSANVIDLCPVGALTSKPFRYSARSWELNNVDAIAAHDCVGSNIIVQTLHNKVKRVLPRENEALNEVWLSDRDRFSYLSQTHTERLETPMIKKGGEWQCCDWNTALTTLVAELDILVKDKKNTIGALLSPSSTLEEGYLLQKIVRGMGQHNIDFRIRQQDFSQQTLDPLYPHLGVNIDDISTLDAVMLIGSNIHKDQPIIGHRLRQAVLKNDTKVMAVSHRQYSFHFPVTENIIVHPQRIALQLAGIAKALLTLNNASAPTGLKEVIDDMLITDIQQKMAEKLQAAKRGHLILGNMIYGLEDYAQIRMLASLIASLSECNIGYLTEGANAAGLAIAGCLPHRKEVGKENNQDVGLHAQEMLSKTLDAYILLGIEPELDTLNPQQAINTLTASSMVVVMNAFVTDTMKQYANILLPISTPLETSGTFVNTNGMWQSFTGAVSPYKEARPAWKVLRVLGNLFELDDFDYRSSEEVKESIASKYTAEKFDNRIIWQEHLFENRINNVNNEPIRISDVPGYAIDAMVRRADALQDSLDMQIADKVLMNEKLAQVLQCHADNIVEVEQLEGSGKFIVAIDESIPDDCIYIPSAVAATTNLAAPFSTVSIKE